MSFRHEHAKPCPVTGEPIPGGIIWSDHSRWAEYGYPMNACVSCSAWTGKTLHDLNEERKELAKE